jgi:hypothetical protein
MEAAVNKYVFKEGKRWLEMDTDAALVSCAR